MKKRVHFLKVAAQGQKIPTSSLVLQFLNRHDNQPGRVGFTVTKKVGNAVVRNRIKRRLRAVIYQAGKEIRLCGVDLVLIGRNKTFSKPYPHIVHDFYQALKKAGMKFDA
nr:MULTISPECIES: ribonuclease P protein component [Commensalibacter]